MYATPEPVAPTPRSCDTGTGSAVLLLHGTAPGTTATGNFAQLIPALTDHHVLAPDLLGFGAAPESPSTSTTAPSCGPSRPGNCSTSAASTASPSSATPWGPASPSPWP